MSRYKLSLNDEIEACVRYMLGERQWSIARRFGVSQPQISYIVRGMSQPKALPRARAELRKRGVLR